VLVNSKLNSGWHHRCYLQGHNPNPERKPTMSHTASVRHQRRHHFNNVAEMKRKAYLITAFCILAFNILAAKLMFS
jgi:hypothetical protein